MAGEQVLDPRGADIPHASLALPVWPVYWAPRGRAKGQPVPGPCMVRCTLSPAHLFLFQGATEERLGGEFIVII